MTCLGSIPSYWRIPAPRVDLRRAAVSSSEENTSRSVKPAALNSLELIIIATGICEESTFSVGSYIPDFDFLKQIYDSATVHLAPNDAESATITLTQGSITSLQLFNIFINALLRTLTATGQSQGIIHGLQIGKDQDDSSQDADHGYQFNKISLIDDISIFAETPKGM